MKKVVVLGGGFAGVTAALTLTKNLNKNQADITLLDKNTFQTFYPSLYEVATSEQPKKNIAIPFQSIFANKVKLIKSKIESIDFKNQKVIMQHNQILEWDYLLICLGSEINYFSIPGLQNFSLPLNTLSDAVKIKDELDRIITQKNKSGQQINIIIAGGGFSGTELTAEIVNYKNKISKKNPELANLINITILEAKDRLLNALDPKISNLAQKRLESLNVNIATNQQIKEVKPKELITADNQTHKFDLLIWTGGIKISSILQNNNISEAHSGRIIVNDFLQVKNLPNVFAAGDCSLFINPKTSKPVMQTGQIAKDQGRVAGHNIAAAILGKSPISFKMKKYSTIIPLKGRYVVADLHFFKLVGFLGWLLQQLVFLRYLIMILPLNKALKKWNTFELELKQD